MTHSRWNLFSRRGRHGLALVGVLLLAGMVPLMAQNSAPAPHDPPASSDQPTPARNGDRRAQPPLTDSEIQARAREMLAKRLENRRREIDKLEHALKMFDEGKSWDEVRAMFPDMPRPSQRTEGRDPSVRRWEEGMPMAQADGSLSPLGAHSPANDPPHPLTPEDRETARLFLMDTAPKTLDRLKQMEKTRPADADAQYAETLRRAHGFLELRKRDPQMYELRAKDLRYSRQAVELAQGIIDLKSADTDSAEYQGKFALLRTALVEQYHVRTQIMQRESDRMARDLAARAPQSDEALDESAHELIDHERQRRESKRPDGAHHSPEAHNAAPGDGHDAPPARP